MPHDSRRRVYVVSLVRLDGKTAEECDARLVELLEPPLGRSNITVKVFEPGTDEFYPLAWTAYGIHRGDGIPRLPP